jgi:hypothetical protein
MALLKTNIDYAGKVALDEIVIPIFSGNYLVETFGARVIPSFRSTYVWHDLSTNMDMSAYECQTDEVGNITLKQNETNLCAVQLTAQLCHNDLVDTALEALYGNESFNSEKITQTDFINAALDLFIEVAKQKVDNIIINGDSEGTTNTSLDLCDGYLKLWENDASVQKVTSPVAITESNVLAEMNRLYLQISKKLKGSSKKSGLKIAVAQNVMDAYLFKVTQAGSGVGTFQFDPTSGVTRVAYLGIEVVAITALPDNTMFATYSDNLGVVYSAKSDETTVNITDMSISDAFNDNVRMRIKTRFGVGYRHGADIAVYGI